MLYIYSCMRTLVLIAHNLRSAHNVGSLLRTCDGLGIEKVYLTGYTPYPSQPNDERLPHLAQKVDRQIVKTALGAEKTVAWQHSADIETVLNDLKSQGFMAAALEQAPGSVTLPDFDPPGKLALVVGREVEGLEPEILAVCDRIVEIPMLGDKESFNVVQAAAMALYHLRFP
jgi:23S rRNA (guanosine2251-2'-O)-methyltransferase